MTKLRPIKPMPFPDLEPVKVEGEKPVLKWVEPTSLLVDGTYQRDLTKRSIQLIRRMIAEFAWNRMKPPIVVKTGPASLHIVDGQHTAIAAATLGLPQIPVFVVRADSTSDRARAFVGHNTDRLTVSPFDIYRALLASGDIDAVECEQVCQKAGVRIRQINQSTAIAEGDTACVGVVRSLVKRRGPMLARQVLQCLVKAKRKPIMAAEINACERILCLERKDIEHAAMSAIIRIGGAADIDKAHSMARASRKPVYRELANCWLARLDKSEAA